jgi:hypothetical protein
MAEVLSIADPLNYFLRFLTDEVFSMIGKDALKIYNTFEKDQEETVESVLKKFEEYCAPKKNEVVQHFKFFTRHQQEGENVRSFPYRTQSS